MDSNIHETPMTHFDIIIVGAGAVGCAVARELSRYQLSIAVLEKECDVAAGTSGRNSAVVHAGFNNKTGSLMAKLCVEGSQGFEALCAELDVPYKKTGKLLVAFDEEDLAILKGLVKRGEANGVNGLRLIGEEELHRREPYVGGIGAMESPETAIFNPFIYTVALAENAFLNGAVFFFDHEVTAIRKVNGLYTVIAGDESFTCRYIVNSAGLFSDRISEMAGINRYKIYPCRGEYYILDKAASAFLKVPLYPAPKPGIGGLGVHLTPTMDGNILIGPSAEYVDEKEDYACTRPVMDTLFDEAKQLLPPLLKSHIIGSYSGIRSKLAPPREGGFRDFVIKEEEESPGLINLIGIESPGMTASMPIARMVADIISKDEQLKEKQDFRPNRKGIAIFRNLSESEQDRLISGDPDYGEIICRCEKITKREIRDAIENPLGVKTISGIKYRARATMGRCQGGYCLTRIADILMREYGLKPDEITRRGEGSSLFYGVVK
jgi:glycerol-3-phosphate dehydrogenase